MHFQVAARDSLLSQLQVQEVLQELKKFHSELTFDVKLLKTTGDVDLSTPLETLSSTDFFTKEIDQMVLNGKVDLGIHSAKDLPCPMTQGLEAIAITEGIDASDSLVFKEGYDLHSLPQGAKIGVSSQRRSLLIKQLRDDLVPCSVRGNIQRRLFLLESGEFNALIVAEAALIRLKLENLPRIKLPLEGFSLQGKLAVVVREDFSHKSVFQVIDKYAHMLKKRACYG